MFKTTFQEDLEVFDWCLFLNANTTPFPSMYALSIALLVEDLQRQVHDNKLISGSVIDIILYY